MGDSFTEKKKKKYLEFDTESYDKFMKIAAQKKKSGVMILEAYDYFENDTTEEIKNPWYKHIVQNVKLFLNIYIHYINIYFYYSLNVFTQKNFPRKLK